MWRARITPWGDVETDEPSGGLRYWVAADDRWHDPAVETSVRQRRVDGTPVTETRLRVPNGDVVQRIWSVPDGGGITLVEFENDSTLPVAVALDRGDLLTDRAPADVPIEGIDLPDGSVVMPLGHRARVRIGLAHLAPRSARFPSGLPDADAVVRGWRRVLDGAGRLDLPAGAAGSGAADAISAQRAEWLLLGPPRAGDDPVGFLIALDSIVRCGEPPVTVARRTRVRRGLLRRRRCWRCRCGPRRCRAGAARRRREPRRTRPRSPAGPLGDRRESRDAGPAD